MVYVCHSFSSKEQVSFNFVAEVIVQSDFGVWENKTCTVSTYTPSIFHEVIGPGVMIFIFWMLSFNPAFSLSSFSFIKRLFSFSSLSAIRAVLSPYLRLMLFLPACTSSSLACHMMPSAEKLNKQGDNMQPCHTRVWYVTDPPVCAHETFSQDRVCHRALWVA